MSSTDEMMRLLTHARAEGVKKLSLKGDRLKVEFFRGADQPEDEEEGSGAAETSDDDERPAKPIIRRGENLTGGLLSPDDAKTLLDPYHDIEED